MPLSPESKEYIQIILLANWVLMRKCTYISVNSTNLDQNLDSMTDQLWSPHLGSERIPSTRGGQAAFFKSSQAQFKSQSQKIGQVKPQVKSQV